MYIDVFAVFFCLFVVSFVMYVIASLLEWYI